MACNSVKILLARKATGKDLIESTSLEKARSTGSDFGQARSRVCYAVDILMYSGWEDSLQYEKNCEKIVVVTKMSVKSGSSLAHCFVGTSALNTLPCLVSFFAQIESYFVLVSKSCCCCLRFIHFQQILYDLC